MPIDKIGYFEINLDTIERGSSQARQSNVDVEIDELSYNIKVQGLINPIHLVEIEKDKKYELIHGQRRYQAFIILREKNVDKFSKIPSFCYKNTMADWEKKSFSLSANITTVGTEKRDKINAITSVYNHFGTIAGTAKSIGLSQGTVRRYVKIARLSPVLKEAVDNGVIDIKVALDTVDMFDAGSDKSESDPKNLLSTAIEMEKLAASQKKRVKEQKKAQPDKPVPVIIDEVKNKQRKTRPITITVESDKYENISIYQDREKIKSIELAMELLVDEGLVANEL